MSNSQAQRSTRETAREKEAIAWFARLRGAPSENDRAAFADWYRDHANAAAYERVAQFWASPSFAAAASRAAHSGSQGRRSPRAAMAAAAVLLVGLGLAAVFQPWLALAADHCTAVGERKTVVLADGSRLTLNTDSAVALALTDDRRLARLLRGEVYLEVAKDKERPFSVQAGDMTVRVIGTAFSVRRADGKTRIEVAHGRVEVARGSQRRILQAKQTVIAGAHGLSEVASIDPERALAWMQNRFIFRNRPLHEVLDELDRHLPGTIVLADAGLGERRVTGNYRLDEPARILAELAAIADADLLTVPGWLAILH